ncbi:MAG: hypothetical protein U9Q81_16830 [Pseudomonadota bacterium]|nr:hypothetical protein [Pseudomonadota bacterium]
MPIHTGRLLLTTEDPFLLPDSDALRAELTTVGFLGEPLPGPDPAFSVGERFLQLVTFAGCSVQIDLLPSADGPFCHILIAGPFEQPRLLSGRNTRPPRCRNCRSPLRDWKVRLAGWGAGRVTSIPCPACGNPQPPWGYDWKGSAGFGRLFVSVEEVFPGEAAPAPALMALLESITACPWRYFYVQDA